MNGGLADQRPRCGIGPNRGLNRCSTPPSRFWTSSAPAKTAGPSSRRSVSETAAYSHPIPRCSLASWSRSRTPRAAASSSASRISAPWWGLRRRASTRSSAGSSTSPRTIASRRFDRSSARSCSPTPPETTGTCCWPRFRAGSTSTGRRVGAITCASVPRSATSRPPNWPGCSRSGATSTCSTNRPCSRRPSTTSTATASKRSSGARRRSPGSTCSATPG